MESVEISHAPANFFHFVMQCYRYASSEYCMQGLAIKINQKKEVKLKCQVNVKKYFFKVNGRAEVKENNSNDTLVRC